MKIQHKLCIAPMMTHTDRHFRYFLRLISPHVMLYTEMITTGAMLNGDVKAMLKFDPTEHPIGIQLGGSDPEQLKRCAMIAQDAGYDEINLNVGCPSDRVQTGKFGACLMTEPELVADAVSTMSNAVDIPVSVKSRIGVDEMDSYAEFAHFIHSIEATGCQTYIIHARKAWLKGLSPRQNREIPPLKYDYVHRLKKENPALEIIINGGLNSVGEIKTQLQFVDGVMIGRAVCNNPYLLAQANLDIFNDHTIHNTRHEIIEKYSDYIEKELKNGTNLGHMGRHILGIFQGQQGARAYRRFLSENIHKPESGIEVIREAINLVSAA